MNNKVITITGPTGSGKSTVSYALAKKLGHCVCIEVDHIKHMIISGFYKQDGNWQYSEWRLVGETLGIVANNFLNRDFDVVIAGYLQSEAWEELEKQVIISHKILLNPSKEVIKIRDSGRDPKYYMGEKAIQEHIDYISKSGILKGFTKVDSSELTVDETVEKIINIISLS